MAPNQQQVGFIWQKSMPHKVTCGNIIMDMYLKYRNILIRMRNEEKQTYLTVENLIFVGPH